MISEQHLTIVATKVISDCSNEFDMVSNTDMVKAALNTNSDSYENLSLLKTKINRAMNALRRGTISDEKYEVRISQISKSLFTEIKSIQANEIVVPFDLDEKSGIFYRIHDSQNSHIYDFMGKLKENLPHGLGTAKYFDGSYYKGEFKRGIREGKGTLMNRRGIVLKEGNWKNDIFFEKENIEYYPDVKVAATALRENNIYNGFEVEKITVPRLKKVGLIAFPVEGDSMETIFSDGDIVICKELDSIENLKDNDTYVIYDKGSIWIKIIQKSRNVKTDNIITCISENHLHNRPFEVKVNKGTRFFKILSQIKYF